MAEDDNSPFRDEIKKKLVETKQQWAKDGRALTGAPVPDNRPRLPPGQRLVTDFPVLDLGITPEIHPADWSMSIGGAVEAPQSWDFQQFMALPQTKQVVDIHCVTTWSRYDNVWEGVSTADILNLVRPKADAEFVLFHSYDGYTTNVPLHRFAAADGMIAHSWNDQPLTQEHGGPVRVVLPQLYFWKSAKWLRRITFLNQDSPGYWEVRGYHEEGDPWKEERYS